MNVYNTNIVLQEIPNEISLVFNITGCNLKCIGCHSPHLWKQTNGTELTNEIFIDLLNKYKNKVSCILFMGGEWHENELVEKLKLANSSNFSTALYSGLDLEQIPNNIIENLTYLKYGKWDNNLGGLDNINTNQRLIKIKTNEKLNKHFIR